MKKVQLQEIAEVIQGGRHGLSGNNFVVDGGYPAYGAGGLNGYLSTHEFDNVEAVVLSSIGARCGKCFYVNGKWSSLANTQVIIPKQNAVDAKFLWYQLNEESRWPRSGTGQPFIKPSDVKEHIIALPSITEQKRIATLLARADRLRTLRRTAHDLGESLLQSVFLEMFGDVRFPETPLSELCSFITKGTTPQSSDINNYASEVDDVPFLKVYHLTNSGKVDFDYSPTWVSNSIHNGLLNRSKVYPNDVLMNIVGPPLGKFGIVPASYPEWNVNQAIAIFRAKKQILPIYLLHALRYPKTLEKMINQAVGVRQLNLSLEQCRDFRIPVPPLSLQEEFAGVVARVESLRGRMGESTRQVEGLFESLLAESFGGEK